MRVDEDYCELSLPPRVVANAGFPFDAKLAAARRFLRQRGIADVRPVYGPAAAKRPAPAPIVEERSLARWFDVRCA